MGILSWLFQKPAPKPSFRNNNWLEVEAQIRHLELMATSNDQAQIKQLIMQADALVDSVLKAANVPGSNMGERLKYLNPILDRAVLNRLWAAHKKRNELAHELGSFVADWEKQTYWTAFREGIMAMRRLK